MNMKKNKDSNDVPPCPPSAHLRLRGWADGVSGRAENPPERSEARGLNVRFSLENESPPELRRRSSARIITLMKLVL
jgi:hypothetical protein